MFTLLQQEDPRLMPSLMKDELFQLYPLFFIERYGFYSDSLHIYTDQDTYVFIIGKAAYLSGRETGDETRMLLDCLNVTKVYGKPEQLCFLLSSPQIYAVYTLDSGDKLSDSCARHAENNELRAVYELMTQSHDMLPPYDLFYMDRFYSQRDFGLGTFVIEENGHILSCASQTAVTEHFMLLSGITTSPQAQGRGLGAAIVSAATRDCIGQGKRPVIMCANARAGSLYERLGFKKAGEYASVTISE